jgi:carbamoyltransferase
MQDLGCVLGVHMSLIHRTERSADSWSFHDTAAALVDDKGLVIAAIEEERLNRIKHSNFFPVEAIRFCLQQAGISLNDVREIAVSMSRKGYSHLATSIYLINAEQERFENPEDLIDKEFQRHFGVSVSDRIRFTEHHDAHAWSAYGCSGLEEALVVVLDGGGEVGSGIVGIGEGNKFATLKRFTDQQSIGKLYERMTHLFGYHRFDEYKIMGLAPYGDPLRYAQMFSYAYRLLEDGDYSIIPWDVWRSLLQKNNILSQSRRKGEPFQQVHKDLAAGLQRLVENIVLHVLTHFRKQSKLSALCIAGGVAHNCSAMGKVYASRLFDTVFVQPAAHDAGLALGSAFEVLSRKAPNQINSRLTHVYLGTDVGSGEAIAEVLGDWQALISYRKVEDVSFLAADLVAEGAVLAWVQGRSEYGPRALGNRSIIADPRPASNRDRVNHMVKKREGYRPFAPSVVAERADEFFELTADRCSLPFMTVSVTVREQFRSQLEAITHVDGSARIQIVSKQSNERYWSLLNHFGARSGFPVVLNTSLNNHAEPIVDSVSDALSCFLTTDLDYLIVGDYVVERRPAAGRSLEQYSSLFVRLPSHRFLSMSRNAANKLNYSIGSNAHPWMSQPTREISSHLFRALFEHQGSVAVSELANHQGSSLPDSDLLCELNSLWSDRAIVLSPHPR